MMMSIIMLLFTSAHSRHTRGNSAKLHNTVCNSVFLAGYLWHGVTNVLNSLPNNVATAPSTNLSEFVTVFLIFFCLYVRCLAHVRHVHSDVLHSAFNCVNLCC